MRKVIIAFDGAQYSDGAMEFARNMNVGEKISLTGLFLPQVAFGSLWTYSDAMTGATFIPFVEDEEADLIGKNIDKFEDFCVHNGINHSVNKALFEFALPELRKETRFADLVIIGSETFYKQIGSQTPNEYLKDAMHSAECPVVVVPEKYSFPEKNILAYDGSESSVFAIKQFTYLFPEFADNPTIVVATHKSANEFNENKTEIQSFASSHYLSLTYLNLDIDAKKYFSTWISEKKGAILVCGAFSRSLISQLFRQSFVEEVLREHRIPVFISHR
jgi:nucleotide-binding universal stress UspA family protein